jgi:branched-subunit amino acid aminotransferase/4-amino-4-deoxychorismate lyase
VSTAVKGWQFDRGRWSETASLPLTDRALRYGMSVFETIGVRNGNALLAAEHLALLEKNARTLLFPVGSAGPSGPLPGESAHGRLGPAVPTKGSDFSGPPTLPDLPSDSRGMLRIYITAGDGGPSDPVNAPRIFALFEPFSGELPDQQSARLHAEAVSPFAHGAKTGNYWIQCGAQGDARAEGFDHALLYDNKNRLLSAAMGNLFFVHDGAVCTPSSSLAVRPGVMRGWVMAQQSVVEVELAADRLKDAEEVFLTNSRLGVMPLHFGTLEPGRVGCALRDRCRQEKIIP